MSTDFLLTDEEKTFKKGVQKFFARELEPLTFEIENNKSWEAIKKAVQATGIAGYLKEGLNPEGLVHQTLIHECASYINYAFETTIASSLSCALPLDRHGTNIIKERYLDGLVNGKTIGAIAITEANVGSDVSSMETSIMIDEESQTCTINGFKRYISNAGVADLYIIYGITDTSVIPQKGMSAIIVPSDTPGTNIPRTYSFAGRHGSVVGEIVLENVTVPLGNMLANTNEGFRVMLGMFNFERILLGGSSLGLARRAFEVAVEHAQKRECFGQKLGSKQLIWDKIAQMRIRLDTAELLTYRAARRYDQGVSGKDLMQDAAMAKKSGTETANFCADQAVQILGGDGLTKEYGITEQLYRDARAMTIVGGTNEMMSYLIAKADLSEIELNL